MAGTTINEGGLVYKTLFDTIKNHGIHIEDHEINRWYGINKNQVLNYFLNRDSNVKNESLVKKELNNNFKKNLIQNYENYNVRLIHPGLPQLFNNLRDKNIKIALNSGFSVDIQEYLFNSLNMGNFIDDYISSEEVPHGRPKPYMIEELMKRNNIKDSKHVIKLGDSVNDILEGKNANCYHSIGVLSGADDEYKLLDSGADVILNSVMDLKI